MITAPLGHGRGWLRADAAASLLRVDRALGHPLDINDAGRTNAEQWEMWRKYGSPRAAYPGTSTHETGIAIDTDERPLRILADHGWTRPYNNPTRKPYEPWHFKYVPANDRHRDPVPAPAGEPAPVPPAVEPEEEDDMSYKPTIHARLGSDDVTATEWTLGHPDIGQDLPRFTGTPDATNNRVDGKTVIYRGFMVTADEDTAKAWARTHAKGIGNETTRTIRDDYITIQRELSRIAVEVHPA